MKSWNEIAERMIVYIAKEIEVFDYDSDYNSISIGKTKMYQKAYIDTFDNKEIVVIIDGGQFDGYDFYWHQEEDSPSELLTKEEYKLLSMSETKVWKELKKYIKQIEGLKEQSEDIIQLKNLIEKHN